MNDDLDAIRAWLQDVENRRYNYNSADKEIAPSVRALLAEVERLRTENDTTVDTRLLVTLQEDARDAHAENERLRAWIVEAGEALIRIVRKNRTRVYPGRLAYDLGYFMPDELEQCVLAKLPVTKPTETP